MYNMCERTRPSWMRLFGEEGMGDVFSDRLWPEWRRDLGEEYVPSQWTPNMNFYQKDGTYYLFADLPGMREEEIFVTLEDGCLVIHGERKASQEEGAAELLLEEAGAGPFYRKFCPPDEVDEGRMRTAYEGGVLKVEMPVKGDSDLRRIQI